jgi:early secretory antigenic target protein ESAT-6
MADGAVWVTFSSIEDAAAQTGLTNRTVQALLDDLYQRLQPLFAAWSGTASENFQYQHSQWVQASDDLNTVLGHIAALLMETHGAYVEAESSVAQLWE